MKLRAFIPNRISNRTILNVYEVMRKWQKLRKFDWKQNVAVNQEHFTAHEAIIRKNKGFIEDQNSYTDMRYGVATMQYSGCEIFAVYNAIHSIGADGTISLCDLISLFERDGMAKSGKFGTSPKALADCLKTYGFHTILSTKEEEFETIAKSSDSLILTMYNDKNDIMRQVHTINISRDENKFIAHNVYGNGKVVGPFSGIMELISNINQGRAKGISLIGISK